MTRLLCIDFDDTLGLEDFATRLKAIIDDNKDNADLKIGIVTARCIFDEFNPPGWSVYGIDIEEYLKRSDIDIRLDFICTTYALYELDRNKPVNEAINEAKVSPVFGGKVSDYFAHRRKYHDEIKSVREHDENAFENLREQSKESLAIENELKKDLDQKLFEKSAKPAQISAVINLYENVTEVMHIDDSDIHVPAVKAYKQDGINFDAIEFNNNNYDAVFNGINELIKSGNHSELVNISEEEFSLEQQELGAPATLIEKAENIAGTFSTTYECLDSRDNSTVSAQRRGLKLEDKPAAKFLTQLGCTIDERAKLTRGPIAETKDVTITGFLGDDQSELTITKARIDELRESAKLYINTKLIAADEYANAKDKYAQQADKDNLQNKAVGICHAQKIDLLVKQHKTDNGVAVASSRSGTINAGDPAIWLLSTPALNFAYGAATYLSDDMRIKYITQMYVLLFQSAVANNCSYITMPAAGLGVFGGDPKEYFECFFEAARLYPELNIIYHPGRPANHKIFAEQLENYTFNNVFHASKDVIYIAEALKEMGHDCAIHNPSDADVVYGTHDIGEYWKNGVGDGYVGEEHIGSMSTAVLNSAGLNPTVYANPVQITPKGELIDVNKLSEHPDTEPYSGVIPLPNPEINDTNSLDNFLNGLKTFGITLARMAVVPSKPKYLRGYQLTDGQIRKILQAIDVPEGPHFIIGQLDPKALKNYLQPILDNPENSILDSFNIYSIVCDVKSPKNTDSKLNHWLWMKTKINHDGTLENYIENSMGRSVSSHVKKELRRLFRNVTFKDRPLKITQDSFKSNGINIQNDGWACGYWSIRGFLKSMLETEGVPASDLQQRIINCNDGGELRDILLGKLFDYEKQNINIQLSENERVLRENFAGMPPGNRNSTINNLLRNLNAINNTKRLSEKIYENIINFEDEIQTIRNLLEFVKSEYNYDLDNAIKSGNLTSNYVNAMTYTDLVNISELYDHGEYRVTNLFLEKELNREIDLNTIIMFISENSSENSRELVIRFPGVHKQVEFTEQVPINEFVARDPVTAEFMDEGQQVMTQTVNPKSSYTSVYCPLFESKGRSLFGINLGNEQTVDKFIKALGLEKRLSKKYVHQSLYTIYLRDGIPLFKYYEGTPKDGVSQESTLYIHEDSPFKINGAYVKFSDQGNACGAIGEANFKLLKDNYSSKPPAMEAFANSVLSFFGANQSEEKKEYGKTKKFTK